MLDTNVRVCARSQTNAACRSTCIGAMSGRLHTQRREEPIMKDQLERNLDAALDAAVEQQRIVGGVVVVLRDGAPVYRRAVGLADREAKRSMQVETLFRLASVTK